MSNAGTDERHSIQVRLNCGGPELQLIAGRPAAKAVEDNLRQMNREAGVPEIAGSAKTTGAAPLGAANRRINESTGPWLPWKYEQQLSHAAERATIQQHSTAN